MAFIDVSSLPGITLISGIDPDLRDIHLSAATVNSTVHPIDIYKEMRICRRLNENLRKYDRFLDAAGNVQKGPGKYTERYVICKNGTRIVPYDTDHELTINGIIITDDGQEGIACFDREPLSVITEVDINYIPPQVEIITVSSGSGLDAAQDQKLTDIANKTSQLTFSTLNKVDTDAGSLISNLPTLSEIEGSLILAKKTDVQEVNGIVSLLPLLSDIRTEMIKVNFGGLEITGNQLIVKDKDNVIIAVLDLFDANNNPTTTGSVFKRTVNQ